MRQNPAAFRYVISECEGTPGEEGYRALFGWRPGNGKTFESFADHPRQYFSYTQQDGTVVQTSAAGKYQATYTTWLDFIRERGPHDFSPASQDEFADWLIEKCGATADVLAGRLRAAIDKCGGRWSSLPSATVPQPRRTYEFCVAAFKRAGGVLEGELPERTDTPQPAAPTGAQPHQREDQRMAPLAIFSTLLPTVLQLFSGKAQAAIQRATGSDTEVATQLTQQLFGKIGEAVGVPITDDKSAIQAVGKLTTAPQATVQKVEDDTLAFLDRMAPLLEKIAALETAARKASDDSHDRAAARADNPNGWNLRMMQVSFTQYGLGIAAILVGALTGWQMYLADGDTPDPALMVLLTAIVMGLVNTFRDQTGFSFGGTVDSNAAAMVTRELDARRPKDIAK